MEFWLHTHVTCLSIHGGRTHGTPRHMETPTTYSNLFIWDPQLPQRPVKIYAVGIPHYIGTPPHRLVQTCLLGTPTYGPVQTCLLDTCLNLFKFVHLEPPYIFWDLGGWL